ncbi:MutS-related protein [Marinilabilia rubra]|uniref:DNA mismatch repair proteins mutS family domain-containing protein n=1 Tax=Marinilabilia rubra TaxID=2162893 RepID=A0A2U2BB48_9BACT|nr:hypothetical protein [Marinilabilia rubra]PWE00286.1 hypothetical protein DDZ16_04920 [Marinilabilia rubra]
MQHLQAMETKQFYKQRIKEINSHLNKLNKYLRFTPPARLLSFVGLVAMGLWLVKSRFDDTYLLLSLLFLVLFILAVVWDLKLARKQKMLKARLKVNEDELKYLNHEYKKFDGGGDLSELNPELSGDFDLFGKGSLFQYLNRTITRPGRNLLASQLSQPEKSAEIIEARQEAIRELSEKNTFREDFRAYGALAGIETNEAERLEEWLDTPVDHSLWIKWAGWLWPGFLTALIIGTIFDYLNSSLLIVPIFGAFFLTGRKSKATQQAHDQLGKSAKTLRKYSQLLALIEKFKVTSSFLVSLQKTVNSSEKRSSEILKKLFLLLEKFDYRLNMIMGFVLNVLFLFDFHMIMALDRWKSQHKDNARKWSSSLSEMDALISMATFAFNNSSHTIFPEIRNGEFTFEGKDLRHPLIPLSEVVGNDLSFSGQPNILVITGANMAGKSTFLRTLAVNMILGMNGAPVCARQMSFTPSDVRSSINIRDSLAKHESYFYAELQRLKSIAEYVKKNPKTLVIMDEILRGTNSLDKHNGSYGLLKKLISLNAVVLIATHDLGIGELENEYPGIATNYCFEVELVQDKLAFDYKLKPGISQKQNASFLMKKMGLTSSD